MILEHKKQLYINIQQLHETGFSQRKIENMLNCSRNTVRKYLNGDIQSVCSRKLASGVDQYHNDIVKALMEDKCCNNIYRDLVSKGLKCGKTAAYDFMNSLAEVYEIEVSYMIDTTSEQKKKQNGIAKYDYISRRDVFAFLWMGQDMNPLHLLYLFKTYPDFGTLYTCIEEFRMIFYKGYQSLLHCFIEKYCNSEIKQILDFVKGLINDLEAVENAVSSPLSNGFVEGTNSKLKMVKRTMYGRCRIELLAAKLMLRPNMYMAFCV